MTTAHYRPRRRRGLAGLFGSIDDFMSWLLYGHETWLVALLKGVPLFIYVYFLLTYVPNYAYYLSTQYLLKFSDDVDLLLSGEYAKEDDHSKSVHFIAPMFPVPPLPSLRSTTLVMSRASAASSRSFSRSFASSLRSSKL